MKMSRSTGEQRMAVSRSRPARRREGGASRGFAMALWATKMRIAPTGPNRIVWEPAQQAQGQTKTHILDLCHFLL